MFLYYLPGVARETVTRATLQAGPLAEILWDLLLSPALYDSRIRSFAIHANGPDGLSGTIVAAMPVDGQQRPVPGMREGQTWVKVCGDVPYWIGCDAASLPTPAELQREHVVDGYEHELGDGRIWICPIVRRCGAANKLPSSWGVDPITGDFTSIMLPRYAKAWADSEKILDAQLSGEMFRPEALQLCCRMLGINYRVGVHEVTLLRLLDDTTWLHVWRAATDADYLEEWLQKEADPSKKKE